MNSLLIKTDTICSLSTAIGGAISVIRISGKDAISIVQNFFSKDIGIAKGNTLHYGTIRDNKEVIDEVILSLYRAPQSYTGEDAVELSCHGSRYIASKIIELLIDKGCRQAERGEFTLRAYANGKMDLSEAEAVADLISANSKTAHSLAMGQMRGCFSAELAQLRERLLQLTSLLELELDFSEEDVTFADRQELLEIAESTQQKVKRLAQSFKLGNAIKNGIPVSIVGRTNVGKSTLLNALLKEERAIVSDIHGTTRDTIEETVDIKGLTFRFIDTAGIRHTKDDIERIGIERTFQKINEASIVLWLIDEKPTDEEVRQMQQRCEDKTLIMVQNKIDRNPVLLMDGVIGISAKDDININTLEEAIYRASGISELSENDIIVTNARHYSALIASEESLQKVIIGLKSELSGDLISEDLRITLSQLGEITGGQIGSDEVLHSIFKNFCIGK